MSIVTIDGPAGTGKSTVAQRVAGTLALPYFDTGAMYRAVTLLCIQHAVSPENEEAVQGLLPFMETFHAEEGGGQWTYHVCGMNVTQHIRTPQVTAMVSRVAAIPSVRRVLWEVQRRLAASLGGVFEGRDMGTVVFPQAQFKIFLTARVSVRAARRFSELPSGSTTLEALEEEIARRDACDASRPLAPLRQPEDAYVIDTSELSIDEVVERIMEYCRKKSTKPAWMQKAVPLLYRTVLLLAWVVGKVMYRLKVYGLEHFYPRGAILAATHTSFLDPPLVSVSWPEMVHFLARESLFNNRWFGTLIRALNAHPVSGDAGDVRVVKTICSLLEAGHKVVLFPEGTRSPSGEIQPIKPGIGLLVSRTQSALIPVYIHGAYEVWGRKRRFPRLWGRVAVVIGTPMTWDSVKHLEKKQAQQELAQRLESAWKDLRRWFEEGAQGVPP